MYRLAAALLVFACLPWTVAAHAASAEADIHAVLVDWMNAFNAGRVDHVCDIFAPALRTDNKGVPERDFDAQCKLLHTVLSDPNTAYSYALDLKDITIIGDMAAVRLVWTLSARNRTTGEVKKTEEQGLDVFGRGGDGQWRILRFMTYERP